VHLANFPLPEHFENAFDEKRSRDWDRLLAARDEVLKAIEPLRAAKTISASLEARVTLFASGDLAELLRKYTTHLAALFIVSQVEVAEGPVDGATGSGMEGLRIKVERAHGAKCERCWNYSTHVGESADFPALCERCVAALAEIEREAGTAAGNAGS